MIRGLFPHPVFTVWYGVWLLAGSCLLSVISFVLFRTFRSIIRYSTLREVWKLGAAVLLKDALMFGYVLMLPQNSAPSMAAIAMGFLLDVLVTLFLLLGLRLGMIAIYDLLKLNLPDVTVVSGYWFMEPEIKRWLWSPAFRTRPITGSSGF